MSNEIIVGMATFPPRKEGMLRVVRDILPQCDKMYVYLNGYTEISPELPKSPKLFCTIAGPGCDAPDLGSHGKFAHLGEDEGFYLTVDDDILYPPDYCSTLVYDIERYQRKAVVGYHGALYRGFAPGGQFSGLGTTTSKRTIYGYDRGMPKDMAMHLLGCGASGCYPSEIGLTRAAFNSPLHSGDDEDLALWAQQTRTPLVRAKGQKLWMKPNDAVWKIDPLHRRPHAVAGSEKKLKSWRTWRITPLPAAVYVAPPVQLPPRAVRPSSPCFDDIKLDALQESFCSKLLSSDALAAFVVDRIKKKIPTSVVRMSDGERACICYSKGGDKAGFLSAREWLQRYGLEGADIKKVGSDLLWAGEHADYLACTISGLFWNIFNVHQYFPDREQFIDQFYPQLWYSTDRVGAVLRAGSLLVLHREHSRIVPVLGAKYALDDVSGLPLSSWRDHAGYISDLKSHPAATVLVSGGASGKAFCVRLAQATGKVVLDVGEALTSTWVGEELSVMAKHTERRNVLG